MILKRGYVLNNKYVIDSRIGAGGMSIVYSAYQTGTNHPVAIKVLREEFVEDENFIKKFKEEAVSALNISHKNIVQTIDVGNDGDIYYIVMEYVNGRSLKELIYLIDEIIDFKSGMSIVKDILEALSYAHSKYIIHRDIKSKNILLNENGEIKIADFGIARAATTSTISVTTNAIGSVFYFSPEQARGEGVDARSDIYSLGILMYELFTKTLPYDGDSAVAVALKHVTNDIPKPSLINPSIPKEIDYIIQKAASRDKEARYESADAMLSDVIKFLNGEEVIPRINELSDTINQLKGINSDFDNSDISDDRNINDNDYEENEEREDDELSEEELNKVLIAKINNEKQFVKDIYDKLKSSYSEDIQEESEKDESKENENTELETENTTENEILEVSDNLQKDENEDIDKDKDENVHKTLGEEIEAENINSVEKSFEELTDIPSEKYISKEERIDHIIEKVKESNKDLYEPDNLTDLRVEDMSSELDIIEKEHNDLVEKENDELPENADKEIKEDNLKSKRDIDENDMYLRKNDDRKLVISAVITSFIIIGFIIFGMIKYIIYLNDNKLITVPDLNTEVFDEVKDKYSEQGFELTIAGEEINAIYPVGSILTQNIKPGTLVSKGTKIEVIVSKNPNNLLMKDFQASTLDEVKETLSKYNVKIETILQESTEVEAGYVIKTKPAFEEKLTLGQTVTVYISTGTLDESKDGIPNLMGLSEKEAKDIINKAGLTLSSVRYKSEDKEHSVVISQTPLRGTNFKKGDEVSIILDIEEDDDNESKDKKSSDKNKVDSKDSKDDEKVTTSKTNNDTKNNDVKNDIYSNVSSEVETGMIFAVNINPSYELTEEKYIVQIIMQDKQKNTIRTVYNKLHDKEDFPFRKNFCANKGDMFAVYINDKLLTESYVE